MSTEDLEPFDDHFFTRPFAREGVVGALFNESAASNDDPTLQQLLTVAAVFCGPIMLFIGGLLYWVIPKEHVRSRAWSFWNGVLAVIMMAWLVTSAANTVDRGLRVAAIHSVGAGEHFPKSDLEMMYNDQVIETGSMLQIRDFETQPPFKLKELEERLEEKPGERQGDKKHNRESPDKSEQAAGVFKAWGCELTHNDAEGGEPAGGDAPEVVRISSQHLLRIQGEGMHIAFGHSLASAEPWPLAPEVLPPSQLSSFASAINGVGFFCGGITEEGVCEDAVPEAALKSVLLREKQLVVGSLQCHTHEAEIANAPLSFVFAVKIPAQRSFGVNGNFFTLQPQGRPAAKVPMWCRFHYHAPAKAAAAIAFINVQRRQ